jgi:hypothetical protein
LISEKTTEHEKVLENFEDRNIVERMEFYDIYLINTLGQKIQPENGKYLTVYIRIPHDFDVRDLDVYRVENGADIKYTSHTETIGNDDFLVFDTNHFSYYAVVDKDTEKISMLAAEKNSDKSWFENYRILVPILLLLLLLLLLLWFLKNYRMIKIAVQETSEENGTTTHYYTILVKTWAEKIKKSGNKAWADKPEYPAGTVVFKIKKIGDLEITNKNYIFSRKSKYKVLNVENSQNDSKLQVLCKEIM